MIICVILLGVLMVVGLDHVVDIGLCKAEATTRIDGYYSGLDCYANNQFFEINLGKDIMCSCYYNTDELSPWGGFKTGTKDFIVNKQTQKGS